MSLISQKDREIVISALEQYLLREDLKYSSMEINALLNWIRLDYHKHEN